MFLLSAGFYIVNLVSRPLVSPGVSAAALLRHPGTLYHLGASLAFAVAWLVVQRRSLSTPALRSVELTTLLVGCTLYALMGHHLADLQQALGESGAVGLYAGVLACANTIAARAIMVPSTARRTFWASSVAMLPLPLTTAVAGHAPVIVINVAGWAAVSIAIATLGSRVIFGLRTEAARVRRLGQYTLEEKIGAGGMGVVYRASHAMLRRPTAIKLLPPDRAGEVNLQRFEREVQLTAQLSHPNTIAIYDYGRTPDGLFYYAMEYLDGINLEELVHQQGPLPPGRVIHILAQVCRALAEAHGRGLLHRDIKPANIFLTERGGEPDVVKVLDFGLVKRLGDYGGDATLATSLVLAGTPLYMPPESLGSPEAVDTRSDLYAVGAVGYYLLTGHPVFEAATVAELFALHLQAEPVPPSRRTPLPIGADLDAAIRRCLNKNLADRPASARALERELTSCVAAGSWSREDAAAWWQRFREAGGRPRVEFGRSDEAATVTVDLGDRLPAP